jgi:hypothetical protein
LSPLYGAHLDGRRHNHHDEQKRQYFPETAFGSHPRCLIS